MQLHLYRPVMLSRAGRCVWINDPHDISPREAALLVGLRWATWVGPVIPGAAPIFDSNAQADSASRDLPELAEPF